MTMTGIMSSVLIKLPGGGKRGINYIHDNILIHFQFANHYSEPHSSLLIQICNNCNENNNSQNNNSQNNNNKDNNINKKVNLSFLFIHTTLEVINKI
jgi:hypothetical protein